MEFDTALIRGTLLKRYKRFLADVRLENGDVITAHCPNPGSMLGMRNEGLTVWLEPNDDPKRKLNYSWKLAEIDGAFAVVDTGLANKIVAEALQAGTIPELSAYTTIKPEVKYGENSRIDFLLTAPDLPDCYVEVKSVTLSRQAGVAEFPDSVTKRGAKHLVELSNMVAAGHRAVMLYLVQRNDCETFTLARDLDPTYGAAFISARQNGVECMCYASAISRTEITLAKTVKIEI